MAESSRSVLLRDEVLSLYEEFGSRLQDSSAVRGLGIDALQELVTVLQQLLAVIEQAGQHSPIQPPPAKRVRKEPHTQGPTPTPPTPPPRTRPHPLRRLQQSSTTGSASERQKVTSGEQRTYSAGSHSRYTVMETSPATCPLNPTVEGTRRHRVLDCVDSEEDRAFVWSSFMMSSDWSASAGEITQKVGRLSDTPSDVSVDYSDNVRHVQECLGVANTVANMTTHYVGRYIGKLEENSDLSRSELLRELGNAAETLRLREYQVIRNRCAECGCGDCNQAQKWEDADEARRRSVRPLPCVRTQVLSKLQGTSFLNLNPTYFRQCLATSQNLLQDCPVVLSPEPPSELRRMFGVAAHEGLRQEIKTRHSTLSTGFQPVLRVPSAVDAIQYTDGDGGTLCVDGIPGLRDYIEQNRLTELLSPEGINGPQLPFREANHDAFELGHRYTVRDLQNSTITCDKPYGYRALVQARRFLASSEETLIVPLGRDLSSRRLVVEVFTKNSSDLARHGEETSVRLIEAGLSLPTDTAAAHCKKAADRAKAARKGIWEAGEFMDNVQLKPWVLKPQLTVPGNCVFVEVDDDAQVQVTNERTYLNEAHLLVGKSTIPGADRGLFLRPGVYRIPNKARICSYQEEPDIAVDPNETTDYLFEVDGRGQTHYYQAVRYDGQNIGRFINQGGLREGLIEMCLRSDRANGYESFSPRDVNAVFQQHCNVTYQRKGRELQVLASCQIDAQPATAVELFGSYGHTYWVKYVASKYRELDHEDFLARTVLWCLLSDNSCWNPLERQPAEDIADDVREKFKHLPCPYQPPRRLGRH